MRIYHIVFFILLSLLGFTASSQEEQDALNYINTYKHLAIQEQMRSGVPAAITLAQGLHETGAGQSELATQANNHFGIKCKSTWTGATYLHDDDAKQECFRKYPSAEASYKDHSDFLLTNTRYHFLFDLDVTDYQGWASGLKRAGYATNPAYVRRLVSLIEKYNLQQYTYDAQHLAFKTPGEFVPESDPVVATPKDQSANFYKGLKGFWAKKGELLIQKAVDNNIRYAKLLDINELDDAPLPYDMFIFTERKRKIGTEEFHIVKPGETMHQIAQQEAMLLSNLYAFNNLTEDQVPEIGEKLVLQYKSYRTPKIKSTSSSNLQTNQPAAASASNAVEEMTVATQQRTEIQERENQTSSRSEKISQPEQEATENLNSNQEEQFSYSATREEQAPAESSEFTNVVKTDPENLSTEQGNISDNSPIRDEEKAKRTFELLGANTDEVKRDVVYEVQKEQTLEQPSSVNYDIDTKQISEPVKEVIVETPVVAAQPITSPQIQRSYNEQNVSDSVKKLKKRFDEIVYRPLPPRKPKHIDTPKIEKPKVDTQKVLVKKPTPIEKPKQEKKVVEEKPDTKEATKKVDTKKAVKKTEDKKTEDTKKATVEKSSKVKENADKKKESTQDKVKTKKESVTNNSKEVKAADNNKKKADSNTKDNSKKTSSKKDNKTKEQEKKTTDSKKKK